MNIEKKEKPNWVRSFKAINSFYKNHPEVPNFDTNHFFRDGDTGDIYFRLDERKAVRITKSRFEEDQEIQRFFRDELGQYIESYDPESDNTLIQMLGELHEKCEQISGYLGAHNFRLQKEQKGFIFKAVKTSNSDAGTIKESQDHSSEDDHRRRTSAENHFESEIGEETNE